ncbi:hypothetical protein AJ87_25900 [Rhizobium yanglingense]|nr:hypothetical protein AJ87_25900 [Rhizobium yanglingense]
MSGVTGNQDVDIDLGQLVRAVWARRLKVVAVTLIGAGVAFAGAKMISPKYSAETRLLIEQRAPAFANTQSNDGNAGPLLDELNIASQVQLLQSADIIKQVINSEKLYELPEFDDAVNGSALSDILVALHIKKNPLENPPEERVIDAFIERLQVYQVPGSRVIGITFTSKDPKIAARIPKPWRMSISRRRAAPNSIRTRRPPVGSSRKSEPSQEGKRRRAEGCRIPRQARSPADERRQQLSAAAAERYLC